LISPFAFENSRKKNPCNVTKHHSKMKSLLLLLLLFIHNYIVC